MNYPNRTVCAILEDMRSCFKTYNFAAMLSLIEELQVRGNRMEAAIDDSHDLEAMLDERRELRKELEDLQKKIKNLKKQLPEKSE
jgi:uncharacterized protein YlxW (UPF0749 family)